LPRGRLRHPRRATSRRLPEKNLAVELLGGRLQREIKSKFARNVVQSKQFSQMLANVIARYQNRSIETAPGQAQAAGQADFAQMEIPA